jgi:hypothetical protein
MKNLEKDRSPPPPVDISATLRALGVGDSHAFPAEMATSVRSIATRLTVKEDRKFKSRTEGAEIRVWRLKKAPAKRRK